MNLVLEFTPDEVNALLQLCDIALRQNGMGALDVVNHFKAKLNAPQPPLTAAEIKPAEAVADSTV